MLTPKHIFMLVLALAVTVYNIFIAPKHIETDSKVMRVLAHLILAGFAIGMVVIVVQENSGE